MHNGDPCRSTGTADGVCSDGGELNQSASYNIRCQFEASASYRYQTKFLRETRPRLVPGRHSHPVDESQRYQHPGWWKCDQGV